VRPKKCVRKSASEKVHPKKSYFLYAWEYVKLPFSLRMSENPFCINCAHDKPFLAFSNKFSPISAVQTTFFYAILQHHSFDQRYPKRQRRKHRPNTRTIQTFEQCARYFLRGNVSCVLSTHKARFLLYLVVQWCISITVVTLMKR
jgi:hypothetical protein